MSPFLSVIIFVCKLRMEQLELFSDKSHNSMFVQILNLGALCKRCIIAPSSDSLDGNKKSRQKSGYSKGCNWSDVIVLSGPLILTGSDHDFTGVFFRSSLQTAQCFRGWYFMNTSLPFSNGVSGYRENVY